MSWALSGYDPVEPFKGPWRVGDTIADLAHAVDFVWPTRSRISDGTKGNEAHQQRNSDHNPWVKVADLGIVTAIDITHDPASGADMGALTESIRIMRHPAVKYVIHNRRIFASYSRLYRPAWTWGRYLGSNPHTGHCHISVLPTAYDDGTAWPVTDEGDDDMLRRGDSGDDVARFQDALVDTGYANWSKPSDGVYGSGTAAAVAAAQADIGFTQNGDQATAPFMASLFARQLAKHHNHGTLYAAAGHGHGPTTHSHKIKFAAYETKTEEA